MRLRNLALSPVCYPEINLVKYIPFLQKHVIATIIGLALPSLFPLCYIFHEVGTVVINRKNKDNLLGVSADGLLECEYGYTNCKFNCSEKFGSKPIPVENKCPYNKDNPYYDKYYTMPEIFAFNSDKCLLATKSENSVIVKFLSEHEFTWELQCQILMDIYDHVISTKPTKFHNRRNELKQ